MAEIPLLKRQARAYLRIADRQLAMAGALKLRRTQAVVKKIRALLNSPASA